MAAFRDELNYAVKKWREKNKKRGCPKDIREAIAAELRVKRSTRKRMGLAALPPERRAEISSMGGRAAHAQGAAYTFTPEKAREAGKLGGAAAHAKGVAHRFSSEEAREAGLKGGVLKAADAEEAKATG